MTDAKAGAAVRERHDELLRDGEYEASLEQMYPPGFVTSVSPCIRRLEVSPANPPTSARRLAGAARARGPTQRGWCPLSRAYRRCRSLGSGGLCAGDLFYLTVETTTLKQTFHITAHVGGFYVNRSNAGQFDPRPAARPCAAGNLVGLLKQLDPNFGASWQALCEATSATPPALSSAPAFPHFPWAVQPQPPMIAPTRAAAVWTQPLDQPEVPGQVRTSGQLPGGGPARLTRCARSHSRW